MGTTKKKEFKVFWMSSASTPPDLAQDHLTLQSPLYQQFVHAILPLSSSSSIDFDWNSILSFIATVPFFELEGTD